MFWAYKPPSFTFPTMPLETSSTMYARMLQGIAPRHEETYLITGNSVAIMRIFLK